MRVLVIEDDELLADGLRTGLSARGATVDTVASVADADCALSNNAFDAIVLDLMLPDGLGLDLLRRLRAAGNPVPTLVLTALDEPAHRVAGLDAGADDYLGKPFDLDELAARLRAVVRRRSGRAEGLQTWRDITLDAARLSVSRGSAVIPLSRREFLVLSLLMERPGVIRTRAEFESGLYGWQEGVESNTVEVYIHNLRAKLGRDVIETVRGVGYRVRSEA